MARMLFAFGGLLLAMSLLATAACGGGSGDDESETSATSVTGTTSPQSGTVTPGNLTTPDATSVPSDSTPQEFETPTSTFPPRATPAAAFGLRQRDEALEILGDLDRDLRDVRNVRGDLEDALPLDPGDVNPAFVPPTWFADCCTSEMRDATRTLDDAEQLVEELATLYSDAGHPEGSAQSDQLIAQFAQIRSLLQSVSTSPTPVDALASLDQIPAISQEIENTVAATRSCCTGANIPPTPTRRSRA